MKLCAYVQYGLMDLCRYVDMDGWKRTTSKGWGRTWDVGCIYYSAPDIEPRRTVQRVLPTY